MEAEDIAFEALEAVAAVEKAITQPGNAHRDNLRHRLTCDKLLLQSLAPGTKRKIGPHDLFAKALQTARDTAEPQRIMPKLKVRSLCETIRIAFAAGVGESLNIDLRKITYFTRRGFQRFQRRVSRTIEYQPLSFGRSGSVAK